MQFQAANMLRHLLLNFSRIHIWSAVGILLDQTSRHFEKKKPKSFRSIGGEDKISELSDDLLVHILLLVPTKDAVATMILSKRWRYVWTKVPKLTYPAERNVTLVIGGLLGRLLDRLFGKSDKQERFIDKSLQVHKAPVLELLHIELGPRCLDDVDVGKWIANAIDHRKVRELCFMLTWSGEPTSLPNSLYTCETLVSLCLSDKILIDVPSLACLPSLKGLRLSFVVYKDEDSVVRLLSSCPILKSLVVDRHHQDNVIFFNINVPSLEYLSYDYVKLGAQNEGIVGTLVIDSPVLKKIFITDYSGDSCLFENKPRLDKAKINLFHYPDNKFMRSLSSIMCLELIMSLATLAWFNTINFSRLIECKLIILNELDWLEPLISFKRLEKELPLSWNLPRSVPECLSNHLEIFEWKGYRGRREEKQIMRYILANSKCLRRVGVSLKSTNKHKTMKELESMSRVSTSSHLIFSTRFEHMRVNNEIMSD
ncbi:F-box domain [Arabidopsis suecica]|uniref:F-box domain n=1 Tax=Arabidopsis suecica TaxID=45249 RepID=A0A8T1ZZ80_ARASU|nr:F-box domain [Arabidopsis suecica]